MCAALVAMLLERLTGRSKGVAAFFVDWRI